MCVSDTLCIFFFFKQKTAYEMRISDWSSDVCSSDLTSSAELHGRAVGDDEEQCLLVAADDLIVEIDPDDGVGAQVRGALAQVGDGLVLRPVQQLLVGAAAAAEDVADAGEPVRHTVGAHHGLAGDDARSEERRVGKECVSTGRSRGSA